MPYNGDAASRSFSDNRSTVEPTPNGSRVDPRQPRVLRNSLSVPIGGGSVAAVVAPCSGALGVTSEQEPIRVFICDDVAELRDLLRAAFLGEPDIRVVGQADNGIAGVMGVKDTQPDVLVLDLSMPEMDGLEAMDTIRLVAPDTRIIVFSGFSSDALSAEAARRGASRYLSKGVALAELIAAVREVALEVANPPAA